MNELARHWALEPGLRYLNHGSFGACPREVLAAQAEDRARLECQPVRFLVREAPARLDAARETLGAFLGADPDGLAFVPNATTAVNAVLRSLRFEPGDEILVTSHGYNACNNAARFVAERAGARVVAAPLPFPASSPDEIEAALLAAVTPRTRLALIDHVTSATALVLPVERIVPALRERGVETLVDGAHAPGQVPLALDALGAGWYTGNAHKWLCAPKGAAFLATRADLREATHPTVISHGANAPLAGRSRYRLEFDWIGTLDPTPWLALPRAIAFLESLVPGGWPEIMRRNRDLAREGRDIVLAALGGAPTAPASMNAAMATIPLPPAEPEGVVDHLWTDALQTALVEEDRIEVPIFPFPAPPARALRVSAQLYNDRSDYVALAAALRRRLA
ncbi:MAG: aminotransferase class V-fold PLP-dependent enzyme [Planctomycetota bacterium]